MQNEDIRNIFDNADTDAANNPVITVDKAQVPELALHIRDELHYEMLQSITAVDLGDDFELLYMFYSYEHKKNLIMKTRIERKNPLIKTLYGIYSSADWFERECFDLMGIVFENHPNLSRILLPEGWIGYPLRKDYVLNDERLIWNSRQ